MEEEVSLPKIKEDNKVIHQLDEVTRDSEKKASEIFDMLEAVSTNSHNIVNSVEDLNELIDNSNMEELNKIKFKKILNNISTLSNSSEDIILDIMEKMQYQDIHRQKIERVINIMRALNNYMNSLFSSNIKDEERVSSAQYIPGDKRDDILTKEEIEEMLKQFT